MSAYPGHLAIVIATGVLSASLVLAPAFAVYAIARTATTQLVDRKSLVTTIALLAAALAAKRILFALSTGYSHLIAFNVQRDVRLAIADRLDRAVLIGRQASPAVLRSTMLHDIDAMEDGIAHLIPETSAALVPIFLLPIVLFAMDWRLALAALLPPVLGGYRLVAALSSDGAIAAEQQRAAANARAAMIDTCRGLPELNVFGACGPPGFLRDALARHRCVIEAWTRRSLAGTTFSQAVLSASVLSVAVSGSILYKEDAISIEVLCFFVVIAFGLNSLFGAMMGITYRLGAQNAVVDCIQKALDLPRLATPKIAAEPRDASVRFENVTFRYGDRTVLDNVTFHLPSGATMAVVGPSGAGKSTLAKLLLRHVDPQMGVVKIGGVDLKTMSPDALARAVGAIFQDTHLFEASVADNIRLGRPQASASEIAAAATAAQAHRFIERLPGGYACLVGEHGHGLSGGERQRVSIARAILHDAPVLALDEATAFADAETEATIQHALAALTGIRTRIVIAHRLSTIRRVPRILVLEQGRVRGYGGHDALIATCPLYVQMWEDHSAVKSFRLGSATMADASA